MQQVTDKFLWYARAVDGIPLMALSELTAQQSKPIKKTKQWVKQFPDFCALQDPAVFTYHKSRMVLTSHGHVGYPNENKAQKEGTNIFQKMLSSPKTMAQFSTWLK